MYDSHLLCVLDTSCHCYHKRTLPDLNLAHFFMRPNSKSLTGEIKSTTYSMGLSYWLTRYKYIGWRANTTTLGHSRLYTPATKNVATVLEGNVSNSWILNDNDRNCLLGPFENILFGKWRLSNQSFNYDTFACCSPSYLLLIYICSRKGDKIGWWQPLLQKSSLVQKIQPHLLMFCHL